MLNNYDVTLYHRLSDGRSERFERFKINSVWLYSTSAVSHGDKEAIKADSFVLRIPSSAFPQGAKIAAGDIIRRGDSPNASSKGELLRLGSLMTVKAVTDNRSMGGYTAHIKVVCE